MVLTPTKTCDNPNRRFLIYKKVLTDEQVTKFQTIYKNRFGKEISRNDVLERGSKLVRLMQIVYSPISEEDLSLLNKDKKTNK